MDEIIITGFTLFMLLMTADCLYKTYDMSTLCHTEISMQANNTYGLDMTMNLTSSTVSIASCSVTVNGRTDYDSMHFYFSDLGISSNDQASLAVMTGDSSSTLQHYKDLPETISVNNASRFIQQSYTTKDTFIGFFLSWNASTSFRGPMFRVVINSYSCKDDCGTDHTCSNGWCINNDLIQAGYSPCANTSTCSQDEDVGNSIYWPFISVVIVIIIIIGACDLLKKNDGSRIRPCLTRLGRCFRDLLTCCRFEIQKHWTNCQNHIPEWSCSCRCLTNVAPEGEGEVNVQSAPQHTEESRNRSNSQTDQAVDQPPPYSTASIQPPPYTITMDEPPTYETYISSHRQISSPPPAYETIFSKPDR